MNHCPCVNCQAGYLAEACLGAEMLAGLSWSFMYRDDGCAQMGTASMYIG